MPKIDYFRQASSDHAKSTIFGGVISIICLIVSLITLRPLASFSYLKSKSSPRPRSRWARRFKTTLTSGYRATRSICHTTTTRSCITTRLHSAKMARSLLRRWGAVCSWKSLPRKSRSTFCHPQMYQLYAFSTIVTQNNFKKKILSKIYFKNNNKYFCF